MFLECGSCGKSLTAGQLPRDPRGVECPYCGATVPVFDQNTFVSQGSPPAEPAAPLAKLQIEGYEILGCLGEGGMGIVYLARQVSLDRKVAIKVMSPVLLKDPSFVARFDREIAALVRLSHPHIVTIFDRGQSAAGHVYYIMEYVEGKDDGAPMDLERLIADRYLDSQRARELMLQVVQALGFAHREGIIHRDVKPSNILIDRHGFAKVADFGIASMRASRALRHVTVANQSVGTAIYMSPEQQRDAASVDHRSDIYAAGVMLYQMLTGELPVAGYDPPSKVVAGLSSQWDTIVARALQQRPENRFADMAAFEAALKSMGQTSAGNRPPLPTARIAVPPGTSRGTSPGRAPATSSQQGAVGSRADFINRAQQLFMEGHWKKAAELMGKAAGLFEGDGEIAALLAQYREKANQVEEVLARMATLAQQNRWCEVSQILAELKQSGVPIKGVDQYAAAAQQRLAALQPIVETARSLLQQGRPDEAVAQANRALQYVTDHAEALEIADSAGQRPARRRWPRRLVVGLITLTCLAAIIAGVYLYFTESVVIQKARRHITNREYDDASQTLTDLPHRYFHDREATYLRAVVDLKKYASAKEIDDDALLQTYTKRLKNLFDASEAWRTQGKLDLADTVAQVPRDAEDALTRSLAVAQALKGLEVAEGAALAGALVDKARGRSEFRSPASEATPADYVTQILEWDRTKARAVVDLALPRQGQPQQGLRAIQGWALKEPSLAGALSSAVLEVADEHVATREYPEARACVKAAKEIYPACDTWTFWKERFPKAKGNDPKGAVEILTFMVQGGHNPEKVQEATDLYSDLEKSHPGEVPPPPDEIQNAIEKTQKVVEKTQFDKLIADAERSVKDRQYQDARTKLDDARSRFPTLWSSEEKARKIHDEVQFQLALDEARKSLDRNNLDAAQTKVKEALQSRPKDKNAEDLRDKIQLAIDKAEVEQHRKNATKAITDEDFDGAVDEIIKAHEILDRPSNASWSTSARSALVELAKPLITKLHDQAKELSDTRQYEEAKDKVALGLRLSSKDEKLSELLKEIKKLEADPKTANISGRWVTTRGAVCELIDNGTDTIGYKAVKLPEGIRECSGRWTREGERLTGKFRVVSEAFPKLESDGTVRATIKDPQTLEVAWNTVYPDRPPIKGTWTWNGIGLGSWTKQQVEPGDAATPGRQAAETPRGPYGPGTMPGPARMPNMPGGVQPPGSPYGPQKSAPGKRR